MIKDIKELNFPRYATLSQATVTLQDMGESTISTQIKIDGEITPDFTYDWEIEFKGDRYIMPLRSPQASKENTSLNSTIDLTFQHWAQYQLKRWYFFTIQPLNTGTPVADQYIASVSLNLGDFCTLFNQVLDYYFNGSIRINLNPKWVYSYEPVTIEISYSYLWDVLLKFYELWAVHWSFHNDHGKYIIMVGYQPDELNHILEYGFNGGLLKIERQIQNDNIRNKLLGRGGIKNLPYRYFKDTDPQNPSFPSDPDWVPELRNIYFDRLRGKTFRDYIRGWKTNPHRQLTEDDGTPIKPYGSDKPIAIETFDSKYAATSYAYTLGHTDEIFRPVEYVADKLVVADLKVIPENNSSIARYGELMGGLSDNDDIYPTIQGVSVDEMGRVDEAIDIEPILTDDIAETSDAESKIATAGRISGNINVAESAYSTITIPFQGTFTVPEGQIGALDISPKISMVKNASDKKEIIDIISSAEIALKSVRVYPPGSDDVRASVGIPAGIWTYEVDVQVHNKLADKSIIVYIYDDTPKLLLSNSADKWEATWDIWIKNIWQTHQLAGESDTAYASRVWDRILGDHTGKEAMVVFSDGLLSTSEDYQFVIVKTPVVERKKCTWHRNEGGKIEELTYDSEWRITLAKSDADLESTGLYLPSTKRNASPGDHFFFVGIDMPHEYVLWAEERLDAYKMDELLKVSDIRPTWVVSLDKVRISNGGSADALIEQLQCGGMVRLADKRFIINKQGDSSSYETLYLQQITYTYNEPSDDNPMIVPDVEITLSTEYETTGTSIETISGEINSLSKQIGSLSNIAQLVRVVGDKLYLRKDGIADRSMSPTEFNSLLTSTNFMRGMAEGAGWGFFQDGNGKWVLETDRINVREEMQVNSLVINQITARGGMIVESAANMEISSVTVKGNGYMCFFDQQEGSIGNLFHIGDVAWCTRFDTDNRTLKYYKRRVMNVTANSVLLSDVYKDGQGIPEQGDIIVQYGSYTDKERQFAKVRDVIGGGYERYIEGLDSVTAKGNEYFFIGKQNGMYNNRPRWYVGGVSSNIEYLNGKFNLNNVQLSVTSSVGDKVFGDIIETVDGSLSDFDTMYIQTQSRTEVPQLPILDNGDIVETNGWATEAPEWAENKYIWQTTYVKKGNGDASFTRPVCISGRDGVDGLSVKNVKVTTTGHVFAYDDDFNSTPTPKYILINATLQGTSGYSWMYKRADKTAFMNVPDDVDGNDVLTVFPDDEVYWGSDNSVKSVTFRCVSGGVYDDITIYKVSSGGDGIDGYTVLLTNESHIFEGDAEGKAIRADTTTEIIAYRGSTKVPVQIDLTDLMNSMPTGMRMSPWGSGTTSAKLLISVYSTLALQGSVNIPVVVDGMSFALTFSWSVQCPGVGVERIVEEYYLSSSPDTARDGEWSENKPEWKPGHYIWTRSHIYYTDGSDETTGEICLLADIVPGGINIIRKSNIPIDFQSRKTIRDYDLSTPIARNTWYSATIWGDLGNRYDRFTLIGIIPSQLVGGSDTLEIIGEAEKVGTKKYQLIIKTPNTLNSGGATKLRVRPTGGDATGTTNFAVIDKIKLEVGNMPTEWTPNPEDFDYLTSALKEDTTIEGGLIQSSMVKLGYTDNNVWTTMSGSSGLYTVKKRGGGIAFWAGGDCYDLKDDDDAATGNRNATYVMRMDGTGYFANGTIAIEKNEIVVGDVVHLDEQGLKLIVNDNTRLKVANEEVRAGENIDADIVSINQNINTTITLVTPLSTGMLQGTYLKEERSVTYTLNSGRSISAGSMITATAKVSFTANIEDTLMANVVFEIIDSSNNVVSQSTKRLVRSGTNWSAQSDLSKTVPADGIYRIRTRLVPTASLGSLTGSQITATVNVNTNGSIIFGVNEQTVLGNNGLMAVWGQSALLINSNTSMIRCGNYGWKATPDGLYYMNGSGWVLWKP